LQSQFSGARQDGLNAAESGFRHPQAIYQPGVVRENNPKTPSHTPPSERERTRACEHQIVAERQTYTSSQTVEKTTKRDTTRTRLYR
jgi:hypothetical protein